MDAPEPGYYVIFTIILLISGIAIIGLFMLAVAILSKQIERMDKSLVYIADCCHRHMEKDTTASMSEKRATKEL